MTTKQHDNTRNSTNIKGGKLLDFIEARVAEGIPISVIYQELKDKFQSKNALLSVFGLCCPRPELKKKYNLINLLIWGNLLGILVLHSFTAYSIYANFNPDTPTLPFILKFGYHLLIPGLLLYPLTQLYKFRAYLYLGIFYLGVSCIFVNFVEHTELHDFLVFTTPWILCISLACIVLKNVFPHCRLFQGIDRKMLEANLMARR